MATVRHAAGAVLDTVSNAAVTVSKTFDTLGVGVGMLNAAAVHAAKGQAQQHLIENETRAERIALAHATEIAKEKRAIAQLCASDSEFSELFKQSYNEFMALLKPQSEDKHASLRSVA